MDKNKIYYKIKNITWIMEEDLVEYTLWKSKWLSDDGDLAKLYIKNNGEGFELYCFSKRMDSVIQIGIDDFRILWNKAFGKTPKKLIQDYSYTEQCLELANWFCKKYCKK